MLIDPEREHIIILKLGESKSKTKRDMGKEVLMQVLDCKDLVTNIRMR